MKEQMLNGIAGAMFDTHIFDKILDGQIPVESLSKNTKLFTTHIQRDEIDRCPDIVRREKLSQLFMKTPQNYVATESAVFGVSSFGACKIGNGKLLEELRRGKSVSTMDALIAETCIKNNFVLVTEDKKLKNRARKFGAVVMNFKEFISI